MTPSALEKRIAGAIAQMGLTQNESIRTSLRTLLIDVMADQEAARPITRPVLRYHGGKFRLAPWLLEFFPQHSMYVEPFGGGASVLLQKPRTLSEVYNDLDSSIVNVFRVLQSRRKSAELRRLARLTLYAREVFDETYKPPVNDVDAALKTIVRSFMGHGSDSATRSCRTGFRAKCHDRALPCIEWANWPESIGRFTERLRGVVIENRDALDVMRRYDGPATLHYVDPPYLPSTRTAITGRSSGTNGYRHEMSEGDHRELAVVLRGLSGMVVLSGYPSALYDSELYAGWARFERPHVADGGKARTEVVWLNEACRAALEATQSQLNLAFG